MDYSIGKAPFSPGYIFQGLYLEALIGHGGSAWVYRVRNLLTGDRFALKLIRNAPGSDMMRRTRDEFKVLEKLQHPNIVKVYGAGLSADQRFVFILMELLEGFAVRDVATSLRRLSVAEVLTLGAALCDAAHAAHCSSIVHRDLKPENIFVLPNNDLRVLDFGLATLFGPRHVPTGRRWRGTPPYMSPEQLRGEVCTPASDVYAIGLILYELASGAHYCYQFYSAPTLHLIAQVQLNLKPSPLTAMVPGFPKALSDIIAKSVEKSPSKRFQSAAAFASALRELSATLAVKAHQKGDPFFVRALVAETQRVRDLNTQNQGSYDGISPVAPTVRAKTIIPAGKTLALSLDTNILRNPRVLLDEWRTVGAALLAATLFAIPAGMGVAESLARIMLPEVASMGRAAEPAPPAQLGSGVPTVRAASFHNPYGALPPSSLNPTSVTFAGHGAPFSQSVTLARTSVAPQVEVKAAETRGGLELNVRKIGKKSGLTPAAKAPVQPKPASEFWVELDTSSDILRSIFGDAPRPERQKKNAKPRSAAPKASVELSDLFTPEKRLATVTSPPRPALRAHASVHTAPARASSEIIDPWAAPKPVSPPSRRSR